MNAWTNIKARVSQLFEPTLWQMDIKRLRLELAAVKAERDNWKLHGEGRDAQVEALARVMRADYWGFDRWDETDERSRQDWQSIARAAFAHIGAGPVGECAECKKLKQKLHYATEAWKKIRNNDASDALDAALEGE